jgi:5-methylcytosine-specific restriction endonuclease McrA
MKKRGKPARVFTSLLEIIEKREQDRERNREAQRRFRERHPELARENSRRWEQLNPDKKYAASRNYVKRKAAAPGRATAEQLRARAEVYDFRCYLCGVEVGPNPIMDHVKPLVKGGSNWPANRRPVCRSCNSRKGQWWDGPECIAHLLLTLGISREGSK